MQVEPRLRLACYDKIYPLGPLTDDTTVKPDFSYTWAGVSSCRTLSNSPAFTFVNIPKVAKSVSLVLTKGDRELGGQEIALPPTGVIPEGAIRMGAPCNPGIYRWTATLSSAAGETVAVVHKDSRFPGD
jgi:hypothetical protein